MSPHAERDLRRVVVTGGAGFIGSHLVDVLNAQGDKVVVVDDLSTGSLDSVPPGVDVIRADVASASVISTVTDCAPDVIVHAAAQVSVARSMKDPARDRAVNLEGTANMLEAARRAGVRRFVFVSSGGAIYGDVEHADEETSPRPMSYYAVHKYVAERYVTLAGISYAVARLGNVYGPRQRGDLEGGVVAVFTDALRRGHPVAIHGTGEQRRDFVYIRDVVSALELMVDGATNGTWNVGTGQATTIRQLLGELEMLLGQAVEVQNEPPRQGDVFSSSLDVRRIGEELGWVPSVPLRRGLQETATWPAADGGRSLRE